MGRRWQATHVGLTALAVVGSTLIALASWRIGALPVDWHVGSTAQALATAGDALGLALLAVSWLVLGRRVLSGAGHPDVRTFALCAAAPMLAAAPAGRDLWAYAAQGNLVRHGIDPYRHGPSSAPGQFAREVSARWTDSPSPYGPLWLRLCQLVDAVCGAHPLVAVLVLRLPAFAGLALCVWAVPRLARGLGGRADTALWLGAASPLMIVLGVGGGHNDLLMLGLALAGLAVVTSARRGALVIGVAVVAVAVLVKSPAAVVLAFTVPVWLRAGRPSHREPVRGVAVAVVAAAVTAAVVLALGTLASGLGLGWTHQVGTDARWVSWLSLPTGVVMLGRVATGHTPVRGVDHVLETGRTVGEVLAVALIAGLWVAAMRRRPARGYAPLGLLAGALAAAAALGPSVQPWYYLWPLVVVGLVPLRRWILLGSAIVGLAFALMITPSGKGWESDWRAVPVLAVALVACAVALWREVGTKLPPATPAVRERAVRLP